MGKKRLEEIKITSFVTSAVKKNLRGGVATDTCTEIGHGCSLFTGCLGCPESEQLQLCDNDPESDAPNCVPVTE